MSYKVPAPVVFLSFNNKINRVLSNRTKPDSLHEFVNDEDVFLLGPNSDLQILDFQHNIVGGPDSTFATFSILDPNHQLENLILGSLNTNLLDPLVEQRIKEPTASVQPSNADFLTRLIEYKDPISMHYIKTLLWIKKSSLTLSGWIVPSLME